MQLKLLTYEQIKHIYDTSMVVDFPDNERKPFFIIEDHLNNGIYDCYGLFVDGHIRAYAFCIRIDSFYLIDYLAVYGDYRNQGLGSKLLDYLRKELKDKCDAVIVEIENADYYEGQIKNECLRRERYYLRGGFHYAGASEKLYHVEYKLLELDIGKSLHNASEMFKIADIVYKNILPDEIYNNLLEYHDDALQV